MRTFRLLGGILFLVVIIMAAALQAAEPMTNLVQWPVAQGGNGHWYAVVTTERPWVKQDSVSHTLLQDGQPGYLATITSEAENQFIVNDVINDVHGSSPLSDYFLGLHFNGSRYAWITGEPTSFVNFDDTPPASEARAVSMWGQDYSAQIDPDLLLLGRWNDTPDDSTSPGDLHQAPAIIEWGVPEITPVTDSPYIKLTQWEVSEGGNGHWYALVPQIISFEEHMALAPTLMYQNVPAHLATVTSAAENDFIYQHLTMGTNPPTYYDQYFLGGIMDGDPYHMGNWSWVTGEPWSYTNWAPSEPNNPDEKALAIWGPLASPNPPRVPSKWNNVPPRDEGNWYWKYWAVIEFDGGPIVCGDVNGDGEVNSADMTFFLAYYFNYGPGPINSYVGDINGNGELDLGDIVDLAIYLAGYRATPCGY